MKDITKVSGLKRLVVYLIQKIFPFNILVFQIANGAITALLLGAILMLGWLSSQKVTEVVTKDFNEQQLVLARHAAAQLRHLLDMIERELSLLSLSPSIQYYEKVFVGKRIGIAFSSIKEEGVLDIRYIEASKPRMHLVDIHGFRTAAIAPEDKEYLLWAARPVNKGSISMSGVSLAAYGNDRERLIMKIAAPVWQVSVDETNPVATNRFSGVLVFVLDVTELIEKATGNIRSGKTGYSWIIDKNGTFLYHPEREFIGKNAFDARKEKKPTISFDRINEIQKTMMLTGKEGTSWYISGWHRGQEGEIRKLIAYAPVTLGNAEGELWSVAVVAPISEVEDSIRSLHIRHLLLQAVIVIAVCLAGMSILFLMVGWSSLLEREVERQTAEFKRSEQKYRSLVENAEDMIFTVDLEGNIISINTYGSGLLGMLPGEVLGKNISDILFSPGGEPPLAIIKEVVDKKTGRQVTHPVMIGDREYFLNTIFRRLLDESGKTYAVLGISRDITERKRMEEASCNTEKLASIGTLAAGVAHEINNPLAVILGFTDALIEKSTPGTREHDLLKRIEAQGLRAKAVVENLLTYTHSTERRETDVDVNQSINALMPVAENNLKLSRISLELDLSPGLPPVKGCSEELQQVFFNIISNAMSAMKGGGSLKVATAFNDGSVEIRFSDTGHGIKREHRGRVFDPLFTTKKVNEGTGLGLSVSYGIIKKHGGGIRFETRTAEESQSTGTTFTVTLPAFKKDP